MSKHYSPLYDWSWQVGRQTAGPDDRAAAITASPPRGWRENRPPCVKGALPEGRWGIVQAG